MATCSPKVPIPVQHTRPIVYILFLCLGPEKAVLLVTYRIDADGQEPQTLPPMITQTAKTPTAKQQLGGIPS